MQAYRVHDFEAPARLEELPDPVPGPGEALVEIRACGLNFADMLMMKGRYQSRPPLPLTLGMEAAGIVRALGPGTDGPAPGTRVLVSGDAGGLAQMATAPASRLIEIPDAMPFEAAAGFQIAYGTSHLGLARRARLQAGETLLVLGAAGGVGLTAVEIGKLMGARVIAVARGEDKLEVCRKAGADHVIDSTTADLKAELKALGGVDVVYDPVGGEATRAALGGCRPEARILLVGFASGDLPALPPNVLLVKNVEVSGFWWGGYRAFAPEVLDASLATLLGWYAEGRLTPHVSHVLPLARIEEAFELLRSRRSTGKVVVTP